MFKLSFKRWKLILLHGFLAGFFVGCDTGEIFPSDNGEIKVGADVIYPKFRKWTSPSQGEEAAFNSPSFEWPLAKHQPNYDIRLSSKTDFSENLIEKRAIPFAIYNPHQKLKSGMWYWQYREAGKKWHGIDSFIISGATREFVTPHVDEILKHISADHPRVFIEKSQLMKLRARAIDYGETAAILEEANHLLSEVVPNENTAVPRHAGKNKYEDSMIAQSASKALGWRVFRSLNSFSQAYILTGDKKYYHAAKKWMVEIANWDPRGVTHLSNFGDSGIMTSLALALDTFWDLLAEEEREKMIKQSSVRADNFYQLWRGRVESRSSSMHVWQHILHQLFQTTVALAGEIPHTDEWMAYIYELWIAQFPKMGEKDGAWFNGIGYFGMNALTIYDMSTSLSELSGVDFQWSDWFRNSPRWIMYAFPPNSVGDGFGNDGDKYWYPPMKYAGYTDAAARMFKSPYGAWYAKQVCKGLDQNIAADEEFRWFRILRTNKYSLPEIATEFDFSQSAHFPDVGVSYMHTSLEDIQSNLMLSATSSPFGSNGHAHAEQNNFNIAYGGMRLFYNSGYRPKMQDPHHQGWHKHTRGHNGILIDGNGQPFDAGAYGWMPRFLHGKQISYAVGDASNAYSAADLKSVDHGLRHFRRHYLMLRPSTIVIYDELKADHSAEWTWLLHSDREIGVDPINKSIVAENELANALAYLYSSTALDFSVADTFSIPARNWNRKVDQNGNLIDFVDQWHFSGRTKEKKPSMRYMAIIQVLPKSGGADFERVFFNRSSYTYKVGDWNIQAEMDAMEPACIRVWNTDHSASLVSGGSLVHQGKTHIGKHIGSSKLLELINGKSFFQEVIDEIPVSIRKAISRGRKKNAD
ncbi:MAG: DUF4962 domain-containing protein [Saprospiraceae bacterium]|nr:DUF4962 domain-containing protein [Saprospiraceae bacterium]